MHHWQKSYLDWIASKDAYLREEEELRLINIKALRGDWAFSPHVGRPPFFLDCSFEHQFNSSSRTLSDAIGKWVLLMWEVLLMWNMWPTVALLQQQQNGITCHFFWYLKINFLIRLHSSTICLYSSNDSPTFVCTQLHLPSDSSTLAYIRLWFVYSHLVTRHCL